MDYSRLVDCYSALESTQSTLEKADILADLFREAEPDELEILGHLVMGRAFPAWEDLDMGIGSKLMVKAIARATGEPAGRVEEAWKDTGDLGDAAAGLVQGKKQATLGSKDLTPASVQATLRKIAGMAGEGSEDNKISRIAELIGHAEPDEARYLVRTIIEDMRVGVGEGLVRNAIVNAFFAEVIEPGDFAGHLEDEGLRVAIDRDVEDDVTGYGLWDAFEDRNDVAFVDPGDLDLADLWRGEGYDLVVLADAGSWTDDLKDLVQHAYDVTTDLGKVARIAKEDGVPGLRDLDMQLSRPVKVMLAQKVESMEDGFEQVGDASGVVALEYKYDGFRVQIHKDGDDVKVFSRRLEDVTDQFPDIVAAVREHVSAASCIIEGEVVAYDPETYEMVPFQQLSKRIKRKYDIQEMVRQIPVTVELFDVIHDGEGSLLEEPLRDRWDRLAGMVDEAERDIELADHLETDDIEEARTFYQEALTDGQEGVMLKNLDASYTPGSRVGYMVKLKPVMETLDLVIVAADWGEGRRSDWLGSYTLACRDEETGGFRTVGKMATGFTDEQLQEMTDRLEPLITGEEGRHVTLEPEVVVEVAYEEIQESPQYDSGYALRFPRLVQVREDMGPDEANERAKIEHLYSSQNG